MSLSDLASLGSLVSGVAVLVSLIYLARQVRQAERNQRALAQQMRASRTSDLLVAIAQSGMAESFARMQWAEGERSAADVDTFNLFSRASFYGLEDAFLQHGQGLMDEQAYNSVLGTMKAIFSLPGTRASWLLQKTSFDAHFVSLVEGLIHELPLRPFADRLGQWNAALAEVQAGADSA
jgi:hypothetical protein